METIIKKNNTFSALFGEREVTNNLELASYCLTVPYNNGTLIFNTLSRELLFLSEEEASCVSDINNCDTEAANYLKKNWYFLPKGTNAIKYCDQILDTVKIMKASKNKKIFHGYTIMTTMECNARCFYCFQKGVAQPRMSLKTAEDLADFILSHADPEKKVKLSWFGGEPLFNTEVMDVICEKLEKANQKYRSTIITNAYLFNSENIKKAKELWKLKHIQVSLDGTENKYNRIKNYIYKDDPSPFLTVINNIKNLLENDFEVVIRLNLGLHNAEDLYNLVDFLAEKFSGYKNFFAYAHRLFDFDDYGNPLHSEEEIIKTIDLLEKFNEYLVNKGLTTNSTISKSYSVNQCMADSDKSLVITPEGKITKCEHYSDREFIGDIYSDDFNDSVINEWKVLQPKLEICSDCPYYIDCKRLKKCPDVPPLCDKYQKNEQINMLKRRIISTYENFKANEVNSGDKQ